MFLFKDDLSVKSSQVKRKAATTPESKSTMTYSKASSASDQRELQQDAVLCYIVLITQHLITYPIHVQHT